MSRVARPVADSWLGRRLELLIGPIAHGGHCVARYSGRVLFVRHCLPGESVIAEVTEDRGGSFCRADAVDVLTAAPERVPPGCEYAHPGGCGGCDFQHVSLAGQRELKAAVVREQLARLAGLDRQVTVLPLSEEGLGWRRRIRFAVAPDGQLGLRAHRSHHVVPVAVCPLGSAGVGDAEALSRRWPGFTEIEVATDDHQDVAVTGFPAGPKDAGRQARGSQVRGWQARGRQARGGQARGGQARGVQARGGQGLGGHRPERPEHLSGPEELHYDVSGRSFRIRPPGFWQTHPLAAEAFTEIVLAAASLAPGGRALDLYAGSGLFTAALAREVGSEGQVVGVEGDAEAARAARDNLADLPWATVQRRPVTADAVSTAGAGLGQIAAVVLDPPRTGAGAEVLLAVLGCRPRTVVYVACDPAALARDLRTARDAGWELADLTAFDAFPMTHHVECIAVLRQRGSQ